MAEVDKKVILKLYDGYYDRKSIQGAIRNPKKENVPGRFSRGISETWGLIPIITSRSRYNYCY